MNEPNKYGLEFHHLGLAVRHSADALAFLTGLGYTPSAPVRDPLQNVNLILCTSEQMPAVEIIYPTETAGPLASILKAQVSVIYHTCFQSNDLEYSLRAIGQANRIIELSPPKPAILFGGRKVSFYMVSGFGVIEILELQ